MVGNDYAVTPINEVVYILHYIILTRNEGNTVRSLNMSYIRSGFHPI